MKFSRNGCDEHSLVGNPMFVDAEAGDFRVLDQSPALQIGFQNFPMDEFGVASEKLREIARQPEIPKLELNVTEGSDNVHQWFGAYVKNVETAGEQSAAGLASLSGIVLLSVPDQSELMKYGFQTGDVIVEFEGAGIKNFGQLQDAIQENKHKKELEVGIIRNQNEQKLVLNASELFR
jgi:S1-C subfamily serine protease